MQLAKKDKRLLILAAAIAGSSAVDFEDIGDGIGLKAGFSEGPGAQGRELLTDEAYRVELDRVALESDELDVRPRDEEGLDLILNELAGPTVDIGAEVDVPQEVELVLTNARFSGRVYDEEGQRLPANGLGIAGQVPLTLRLTRTGRLEQPVDVRFEVPTAFFDGIDWAT